MSPPIKSSSPSFIYFYAIAQKVQFAGVEAIVPAVSVEKIEGVLAEAIVPAVSVLPEKLVVLVVEDVAETVENIEYLLENSRVLYINKNKLKNCISKAYTFVTFLKI